MSKKVDSNTEQTGGGLTHLIGLSGTSYAGVRRCLLAILLVLTLFVRVFAFPGSPLSKRPA